MGSMVRQRKPRKSRVSALEALRPWSYVKLHPTVKAPCSEFRSTVKLVFSAGARIADRSAKDGVFMGSMVRQRRPRKSRVSALEALRPWSYVKLHPTVNAPCSEFRSTVKLVFSAGARIAVMLLLVVPLLTLEADARGGGGGGGHGGGGGGGHGGGGGGGHGGFGAHFGG